MAVACGYIKESLGFEEENRCTHEGDRYIIATADFVSLSPLKRPCCLLKVKIGLEPLTIQRDVVYATQQKLPEHLRVAFKGTLRPELINFLRENLLPLHTKLLEECRRNQIMCHDKLVGKISCHYQDFSADIKAMKRLLGNPGIIQTQVRAALVNQNPSIGVNSVQGSNSVLAKGGDETHKSGHHINRNINDRQANKREGIEQVQESLREVY
jgi:hypothetical protein